jgi:hypothetical protein
MATTLIALSTFLFGLTLGVRLQRYVHKQERRWGVRGLAGEE